MGREEWVTVALEEYKPLRQESLAAIEQMQRTLQIGLVAIGVLTAFAVEAVGEGAGVQVGLALAAPLLAALVAALRLDELLRAVAAGAHIALLEQQIARRVGDEEPPLSWESNIQKTFSRPRDRLRHWATLLALFAAAVPTAVLGISDYGERHGPEWAGGLGRSGRPGGPGWLELARRRVSRSRPGSRRWGRPLAGSGRRLRRCRGRPTRAR